ncbi:hypothetical protein [Mycobacterium sp. 1274761.0]|uniref:hypothetical protein n=1 Tax=Mycobacterium sp. 1274761.0 TaxID=1834077 RepID=UPI000AD8551B|nr:hypothetical protein [Mycobacterium sp. 1274761.0]
MLGDVVADVGPVLLDGVVVDAGEVIDVPVEPLPTVMPDFGEMSARRDSSAFFGPNFVARSQNREADLKSVKDVEVCFPLKR